MRAVLRCNSINSRRYASALHMTATLARSAARFSARPALSVVTLTALAFGLRLVRLGVPSLWHDEAISALLAERSPGEIVALTAQDVHPQLYYLALHAW